MDKPQLGFLRDAPAIVCRRSFKISLQGRGGSYSDLLPLFSFRL
jgi:hypothetical protein